MKLTKKIIAFTLSLTMLFSLSACKSNSMETDATKFMDKFLSSYKSGDFKKANAMTSDPNFIYFQVAPDKTFPEEAQKKAIELMKDFDYKYLSQNVVGDTTTLEIEFTVKDVGDLFTSGMKGMVLKNIEGSNSKKSNDEIANAASIAFKEAFKIEPSPRTETIIVELKKTDSGYVIVPTGELLNMLMGNLLRAQQAITQSISNPKSK